MWPNISILKKLLNPERRFELSGENYKEKHVVGFFNCLKSFEGILWSLWYIFSHNQNPYFHDF